MRLRCALASACLLPVAPLTVRAAQYEVFVDVETEEDLRDLLVTDQISESSFNALLLLQQTRVDLNRASRQRLYLLPNLDYEQVDRLLAYRTEVGSIRQLGDLAAAGVLESELVETLRAFVVIRAPAAQASQVDGFVRVQGGWTGRHDRLPPPVAVQARIEALGHLDIGLAAALTRNDLQRVRWDPDRAALSAERERVRLQLPKLYVEWSEESWELIAGTYRIGFGQRLTFDVTDQVTANGFFGDYELRREGDLELRCRRASGELRESPCPSDWVARITPDFAWTNRLTGAAVGLKGLSLGEGWLQVYVWGSYQVHRIPQIELVDARACDDPRLDEAPECKAPTVYIRDGDPTAPSSVATFASLPAMYAEGLAGLNTSFFWSDRTHLGLTGYGAFPKWLVEGVELGFQEFSRKPFGGPFGAVGLDASFGFRGQDFFLEIARSFDAQVEGGGAFGAIARSVTTLANTELDVSARYYASSYANPYARPVSAPDELDGLRARDEAGIRARVTTQARQRVGVRVLADAWRRLSSGTYGTLLFVRTDLWLAPSWDLALWVEYRNSLSQGLLLAARLAFEPFRRLTLSGQFQHRWAGANLSGGEPRQDIAAVFNLTTRPVDLFRLRLRLRYDFEDIWDNHRLPQRLWSYFEAAITLRAHDLLRFRYDFRVLLDRRESTRARQPNPEHWLWLEYVFRY